MIEFFVKIFVIAKWELIERIRTKSFLISTVITPLILISLTLLPSLYLNTNSQTSDLIGILDFTGDYSALIKTQNGIENKSKTQVFFMDLYRDNISEGNQINEADSLLQKNNISGYLLITKNRIDNFHFELRTNNRLNNNLKSEIEKIIYKSKLVLESNDFAEGIILSEKVFETELLVKQIGEGEEDFITKFYSSFIYIIILTMMIIFSGNSFIRSMLEEKSTRLFEVLSSSVSPVQLLLGKTFGLTLLGLAQILIWSLIAFSFSNSNYVSNDLFSQLDLRIIYFVLGYLFYVSIFVGVGSAIKSEQSAQQISSFITILLLVPVFMTITVLDAPNSFIANLLAYIPFTAVPVMMIKLNLTNIEISEHIYVISLMLISTLAFMLISSKIFLKNISSTFTNKNNK